MAVRFGSPRAAFVTTTVELPPVPVGISIAAAALALVTLAAVVPASAATRVYRCTDAGRVLYSDTPCRGAAVIDLPADRAAPDASERLRRDQQQLDATAAARRARVAREQAERDAQREQASAARAALATNDDPGPSYGAYGFGYGYGGYGTFVDAPNRRAHRIDPARATRERARPAPVVTIPLPAPRTPLR